MSYPRGRAALATGLVAALGLAVPVQTTPPAEDQPAIVHLLSRATFGPRQTDIERVSRIGLDAWIDEQLSPSKIPDEQVKARLARLTTVALDTRELAEQYFLPAQRERLARLREGRAGAPGTSGGDPPSGVPAPPQQQQPPRPGGRAAAGAGSSAQAPAAGGQAAASEAQRRERQVLLDLSEQKLLRAVYSERQLQEVMTDFWFNHFNVFAGKGQVRLYLSEYEREVIRPRALGKFRDLLVATAKSPAMLFYLDNWMSAAPSATAVRAAQPRVLPRGRAGAAGRRPVQRPGAAGRAGQGARPQARARGLNENYARELLELHTLGVDGGYTQQDVTEVARCFTGWTIDRPQQGGGFRFEPRLHDPGRKMVLGREVNAGGERDGLEVLDRLARHPSTARHLATKIARRFVADEPPASLVERAAARFTESDGDIAEVVRLVLTSPEFRAPEARRAKLKTPLEFVASALRATGAEVGDARGALATLRELGMAPYSCQPPTGYADRADAWSSAGALLTRMNFAVALAAGRLRGISVDVGAIAPAGAGPVELAEALLHEPIAEAARAEPGQGAARPQAIGLVLGGPQFQRR